MAAEQLIALFSMNPLAQVICLLVLYIGIVVGSFAARYMKGNEGYTRFFIVGSLLTLAVMVQAASNHLVLLLGAWAVSCLLLVQLMTHKKSWQAASESGLLATKTLGIGFVFIVGAFALLYMGYGTLSITEINSGKSNSALVPLALTFLLIGAMTQSGIWPFHKWVLSSLNSPTPVSAMMHAGLVNGGGILLAKFAPLYIQHGTMLSLIFVIGLFSALLGTLWKLMQCDVKRMLACSTMGQMGFMVAQIGLGLFPAAIAHLCWHGMFKSYLFLASGGAAQEKRLTSSCAPKAHIIIIGLVFGAIGSMGFMLASRKSFETMDTNLVLIVVAMITGAQFTMSMLQGRRLSFMPIVLISTIVMEMAYGGTVYVIEAVLEPMNIMRAQPLNAMHIIGILILFASWLSITFISKWQSSKEMPKWLLRLYVKALNSSQPGEKTVTSNRQTYKYL